MSIDWYYQANGRVVGPVSSSTLRQLADGGILSSETAVRRGSDVTWSKAKHVRGLFPEAATVDSSGPSPQDSSERTDEIDILAWVGDNRAGSGVALMEPASEAGIVHKCRDGYLRALNIIDNDVGQLIRDGKEMKGLQLLNENMVKIVEIHDVLARLYVVVWKHLATLEHFGSKRLRNLGHIPLPIRAVLRDEFGSDEETERAALGNFWEHGLHRAHWLLKEVIIIEIEYMLDALRVLIEPDFEMDA